MCTYDLGLFGSNIRGVPRAIQLQKELSARVCEVTPAPIDAESFTCSRVSRNLCLQGQLVYLGLVRDLWYGVRQATAVRITSIVSAIELVRNLSALIRESVEQGIRTRDLWERVAVRLHGLCCTSGDFISICSHSYQ
jgi:hypothetical protein